MKQQRPYPRYTVSRKAQASIENGHPWVYEDEICAVEGEAENGALVDVLSDKGRYLGTGFLSAHSKIRVRLVSRNANDSFDEAFWRRRLQWAWAYRKQVLAPADLGCCRVIFGEADQLPGLTVDRFGPYLVAQTLSVGIERLKGLLFPLLAQVLRDDGQQIAGLYERNDLALREREGLEQGKGFFPLPGRPSRADDREIISKTGCATGWTLKTGRKPAFSSTRSTTARRWPGWPGAAGCWTASPTPALSRSTRALGGAEHVTAVDVSEAAVEMARANAAAQRPGGADGVCRGRRL